MKLASRGEFEVVDGHDMVHIGRLAHIWYAGQLDPEAITLEEYELIQAYLTGYDKYKDSMAYEREQKGEKARQDAAKGNAMVFGKIPEPPGGYGGRPDRPHNQDQRPALRLRQRGR